MSVATQPRFDDLGTPLISTTFAVLDLETTGLSPERDRITEVGVVKVRGGSVLGELQTLVHPGRAIPVAVTAVTGITDAMVADAPTFAVVGTTLHRFLADAVLVAHNASFDMGFLRAAFSRLGFPPFTPQVVDTVRLARRLLRDEVRNMRLETLARHLRSHHIPTHRALADARATTDVLHGLIERAGSLGATTVEDLQELTRSRSDRRFRRIHLVAGAPEACGVYRFLDARDQVLYVGKATNLRRRLRSYFGSDPRRRIEDLVRETARVEWTATPTLLEAEIRELREIRSEQPRFNRRSKRAVTPAYIAITKEPFPRLSIVGRPRSTHHCAWGPFPSRKLAERVVEAVHETFPIRPCTPRLRVAQDHGACIAKELGRCTAPCDGSVSREGYDRLIQQVVQAFNDPTPILIRLRERMRKLAADGRFEQAAATRERLHVVARSVLALQRRRALSEVAHLVVERTAPTHDRDQRDRPDWTADGRHRVEVAVIRHGRLQPSQPDAAWPEPPKPVVPDHEELDLLLDWLTTGRVRVRSIAGTYVEPTAGSALLAEIVEESRVLARQLRTDRHVLTGTKVRQQPEKVVSDRA